MDSRPVALVTGSSRGIGRAIAVGFGRSGYDVVVNYCHSEDAAAAVAAEVRAAGSQAVVVGADNSQPAGRDTLLSEARAAFGRIDVLVNNAGITSPGRKDLLDATESSWDQVFDTNLKAPFFLAQGSANAMRQLIQQGVIQRGTIINISSISAYAVSTTRADYCMAKAAMEMMTWLFADRLAEEGIRVFEICPGIIASDMTDPVKAVYDRRIADGLTPMRRWGTPQDVAKVAVTLVSDTFAFSTGDRFNVDGGFHIRRL